MAYASLRNIAATLITLGFLIAQNSHADSAYIDSGQKVRCGWFDNPSPNNATLMDADGEWTISRQGGAESGYEAKGKWPKFNGENFVRTGNGSYGYGCACMKVSDNIQSNEIATIYWAKERPLSACRKDSKIRKNEPFNPLN